MEDAMTGVISGKHLICCGATILREYGACCYLRCALAVLLAAVHLARPRTFLSIVWGMS